MNSAAARPTAARLARFDDLAGLLELYRELRPRDPVLSVSELSGHWERMLCNPDLNVIVADPAGSLAATCMLAIVANLANGAAPFGVIEHVVTAKALRRRGLGRAVLEFALELAWSRNCHKVVLLSGVQRSEAHALYRAIGFRDDVEQGFVIKPTRSAGR